MIGDIKATEEHTDSMEASSGSDTGQIGNLKPLKRKWYRWQKIFIGIVVAIIIVLLSGISIYCVLRARGEHNLKTEEHYTVHNGKKYKYREDVINILCLGIDKTIPLAYMEAERGNIGMSDTIILVSIDVERDEVRMLAIPRDTMTSVQIIENGRLGPIENLQICYQYAYGETLEQSNRLTVDAVSRLLYNTPIQRCCSINIEAIMELNDAIGGVDVNVPEDLTKWDPNLIYGARIHLEGRTALNFIQVRNTRRVDGSALRTQRQKQYALAFVEKAKNIIAEEPTLPIKIFQELEKAGNMCTDITIEDITYLMSEALEMSFTEDMIQVIPGESVLGEDGFVEYHKDTDALKEIVINAFYDEV